MDDWREELEECEKYYSSGSALCKSVRFYVIGAALGIIAALIQMGSTVLGFIGKPKIWAPIQILVAVLCVVGMALPASEKAFDRNMGLGWGWVGSEYHSRALYFLVWSIIDAIAVLVFAAYVYKLSG